MIYHLVPAAEYQALPEAAPYLPAGYAGDGFIHCTAEPQVLVQVANAFYRHVPGDFLVLEIDPARLAAEVRYEPAEPGSPLAGHRFPHIYGPLNRSAVVHVRSIERTADGTFLAP